MTPVRTTASVTSVVVAPAPALAPHEDIKKKSDETNHLCIHSIHAEKVVKDHDSDFVPTHVATYMESGPDLKVELGAGVKGAT